MVIRSGKVIVLAALVATSGCDRVGFESIPPSRSGVTFVNEVEATTDVNIFNYLYFFNGAGVAIGDLNGDLLPDICFTSNQGSNALYLNLGDFVFRDISERIASDSTGIRWNTGVGFHDIDGDSRLDIYINRVGSHGKIQGRNLLWINQGNDSDGVPMFEEKAASFGLDLVGYGTQTAFFDFDLDGDLDAYQLNHSVHSNGTFGPVSKRSATHPLAGDRLLENRDGKFVDISAESGIHQSPIGYGLGITVTDINEDGYPDVYVGNDFHEDDYLYINQGDRTMKESLSEMMGHTSRFSMGNDVGDIDNDGLLDILSLDMLPRDYQRLKSSAGEDDYQVYMMKREAGYKDQHVRNTLQLNRGNGKFSEVALFAGLAATDWSWSGLFGDFDLDGYSDVFVSNGILGRANDMDYIRHISHEVIQARIEAGVSRGEALALSKHMPVVKIPNYMFRNNGDLTFQDVSALWGLDSKSFSNGAAYGDLDLDGDLDLVVNNIGEPAFILRNLARQQSDSSHYLLVRVKGRGKNTFGVGTRVRLYLPGDVKLTRELFPVRGYLSSMDYTLHFGLGNHQLIPRLEAVHPGGVVIVKSNVKADQILELDFRQVAVNAQAEGEKPPARRFLREITSEVDIDFVHKENRFIEFLREPLIPRMISRQGPALAVGDVNGDRRDDLFFGGAKGQHSWLFVQNPGGDFDRQQVGEDPIFEDVDAVFGDFDADGHQDLLIASGGNEFRGKSPYRRPRLFINDGKGNLERDDRRLPTFYMNGSVVATADMDGDGDVDVFLGARSIPWKYGVPPASYLLENTPQGFQIKQEGIGSYAASLGMVTDAGWHDMDGDGLLDLLVCADWGSMTIIYQTPDGGRRYDLAESSGLWNALEVVDLDSDGLADIVGGNLGLNSKLATRDEPLTMYVGDMDGNGTVEQIITRTRAGKEWLVASKKELEAAMDTISAMFPTYTDFSKAPLHKVVPRRKLQQALTYRVRDTRSSIFFQQEGGSFSREPLPSLVQLSPVMSLLCSDFNRDSLADLLLFGNDASANIRRGVYDASYGEVVLASGIWHGYRAIANHDHLLYVEGEIRRFRFFRRGDDPAMVLARNNDTPLFYQIFFEPIIRP